MLLKHTMTQLTEIDGVGPSYAEDLQEAGFDSAEDVASADVEALDALLDTASGEELKGNASAEVGPEDGTDDDGEAVDPAKTEVFEIDAGFSDTQEYHLIAALVNQEVDARRSNSLDRLESVQDALAEVRDGAPYELTLNQLSIAYTGVNQLESEYRGVRGLADFVGGIREVRNVFQDARRENWPDNDE